MRRTFTVLILFLFLFIFYNSREIAPVIKPLPVVPLTPAQTVIPSVLSIETTKTASPTGVFTRVVQVIDGDTVEGENGVRIRYIGIDTPETHDPRRGVQCFGAEASEKNAALVKGKRVRLEKDISETDKYGRLLRYVYVDGLLVNEYLVREGYAKASSYPPDVALQPRFRAAEAAARSEGKGMWGPVCQPIASTAPQSSPSATLSAACDCRRSCAHLATCADAAFQLKECGCAMRDGDGNGIPCEGPPLLCK